MIDQVHVVHADIDPKLTLKQLWQQFSAELAKTGAEEHQLSAMELSFYMGAMQAFTRIDAAARVSTEVLSSVMHGLHDEIEEKMSSGHPLNDIAGNA